MKRLIRNPKHWIYVLSHLVIFLLGVSLIRGGSAVEVGVGGSLVAAGMAGWVILVYVLFTEEVSERLNVLAKFGLESAFDARSVRIKEEYVNRLIKAHDQIDVMGFGLNAFREDFLKDFVTWKEKASVRVLLIDPEFPIADSSYAGQRDSEENNPQGKITSDVMQFIKEVGPLTSQHGKHTFEIRLYRCLPTLNIFRIDDDLFWGPYLIGTQSRNMPTFLVKRGGLLFGVFTGQFNNIWDSPKFSRPIPSELLSGAP